MKRQVFFMLILFGILVPALGGIAEARFLPTGASTPEGACESAGSGAVSDSACVRGDRTRTGSPPAGASDSLPLYWAKEIIVTAKRVPSPVENLALSVSVLGPKEIELAYANSSTDLAGNLPGVFIQRTGSFGRSDVNIRGLGSRGRRAVNLVDGRPDRMALFDCSVTHSFLLHDVERIEVVRGPSSVLYGSGALGGVFNVIRKEPGPSLEVDLKTAGGSYETAVASGRVGKSGKRVYGSVSADYRRSDGHVDHSGYEGTDVVGHAGVRISSAFDLAVYGKYFDGFKEEPLRATDDPTMVSNTWNDYERGTVEVYLKGEDEKKDVHARYYHNFGEHVFSDGWHSRDATDGGFLYGTIHPAAALELSTGADYRLQQGERLSDPPGEWDKWDAGVYATVEYSLLDIANLSAGVRYNADEASGEVICPSFGIVGRLWKGGALRVVASKGFRSPQINELYMFPSSNENLETEILWDYELGFRQQAFDLLHFDIAVFRMDGDRFIESGENPAPPPLYLFQNTGPFEFKGFETSIEVNWKDMLGGRLSYSYLDAGELTRGRPGRQFDLSVLYTHKRFNVRLTGSHIDDYYAGNNHEDEIGASTVVSLYTDVALGWGIAAFFAVDNILDEEYHLYVDLPGGEAGLYEMPGRNYLFGLKYLM